MLKFNLLIITLFVILSCSSSDVISPDKKAERHDLPAALSIAPAALTEPIGEYIVAMFEDSRGHLWFGTIAKGIARYDGKSLTYFTKEDGLPGNAVVSMVEDKHGNLWFGTQSGLSKYDGETFTNFTEEDGLIHFRVSNLLIDSNDKLWVGTWGGVSQFDGSTFSDFPLPIPDVELLDYQTTMEWVTEIMEDPAGNIWIGRDGYGASKYDPKTGNFTHFTKKEGLPSNNVQAIEADEQGNIWFGSRVAERDHPDPEARTGAGGLSKYDGERIVQFTNLAGLSNNSVSPIYTSANGEVWISAKGVGLYRYDGTTFHLYENTSNLDLIKSFGLQGILEDRGGTIWLGFSGGLFRLAGDSIIHVAQGGPWE